MTLTTGSQFPTRAGRCRDVDRKGFLIEAVADHNQVRGGPPRIWGRTFPGRPRIRSVRPGNAWPGYLDGCPVADDAILCPVRAGPLTV